jgi:hypothetical protein
MEETHFDTDWIEEQEKMQNIEMNYQREHLKSINVFFIYVNRNNNVEKIIREKEPLVWYPTRKSSLLSKEKILELIQTRKIYTPDSKYKFEDVLSWNVDIEPENIETYSNIDFDKNSDYSPYLKVLSFVGDIYIPDSIFIFHETNSLFFIFKEYTFTPKTPENNLPKSILKAPIDGGVISTKSTKKVRIQTNIAEEFVSKKNHRKTRKIKMIMKNAPILENTAI